jgi:Glycosyl transferases group 1
MNLKKKILQISPFEPPASGWTKRIKLLRRVIEDQGGICQILDIGPSRKIERPGCIGAQSSADFLRKVIAYSRQGFTIHCHVNAEYFRGLLLALAACLIGCLFRNRVLTTFHGGTKQRDFEGWRSIAVWPFFWLIFSLSDAIICNSVAEKALLSKYQNASKIFAIPAFSIQYLDFTLTDLPESVALFAKDRSPLLSTYLCFRDGFYTETVIDAISNLVLEWPKLGLVIVGTGDEASKFLEKLGKANLLAHVCLAGDLSHSAFMTLVSRSALHLRTPTTDGVSATVLEALSLRIPVVASENGNRPASVITYAADDPYDLAKVLNTTLQNRDEIAASLLPPKIEDTAETEVRLLFGNLAKIGTAI